MIQIFLDHQSYSFITQMTTIRIVNLMRDSFDMDRTLFLKFLKSGGECAIENIVEDSMNVKIREDSQLIQEWVN